MKIGVFVVVIVVVYPQTFANEPFHGLQVKIIGRKQKLLLKYNIDSVRYRIFIRIISCGHITFGSVLGKKCLVNVTAILKSPVRMVYQDLFGSSAIIGHL